MKTLTTSIVALALVAGAFAQGKEQPLWPNGTPGAKGDSPRDIPTLTPFLAPAGNNSGSAIVICPGGGYGGLAAHEGATYAQFLQQHGVSGFVLKYRLGSAGYRHPVMLGDAARALRTVRANATRWKIDPDKIGIIGGSYGGFMVAAALAFEPDVFDAGINIFGVTNWLRTLQSIPPWWGSFRDALYDEMGDPAEDEERLRRISPLFHADQITKPLLVIQGANDPRVLQVESDELVAAARANGATVEYVLFPDEGHGFQKRENRITASEAYVDFLNTYLKGEPAQQQEDGGEDIAAD